MSEPKTIPDLEASVTSRERLTCLYLAQGMTHQKAGIEAGYTKKSAAVTVSRMLKKPNIQRLLTLYRNSHTQGHVFTRQKKLERLYMIGMVGENADALRAIDLDNKMNGHYEPQKINLTGDLDKILSMIREKKD